ncbi:MAG: EF-hand domain-containing protein [Pseudomonadales bacterium]|nr:EF-hand domain-containing protein [Pseudomonadales bacterium]MBO6564339.1 EF-hand domain-containing protein [Pseudomonadales bacterium]MBO6596398.1 EF-hand domain-containing protein [Pseudomonadales bacterium]MBO6657827.1 EF-hand domain-containing protein [Pseudomonadales bacterium]MBO6703007.1 EF-hand domain-containing protein [Pseudomonadales bacterium]
MNTRKILVSTMALAFAANVATVCAKPFGPGGDRGLRFHHAGNAEEKTERIMNVLDTDESGTITLDEWLVKSTERAERRFERIDTDDDALISLEEFLAVHSGDTNHPEIDRDAVRACVADATGEDIPERPDRETRFNEIDTNDDGFVDLDEMVISVTSGATDKFNRIDVDADGAITEEELIAALEDQSEIREIRRDCVEEQRETEELLAG